MLNFGIELEVLVKYEDIDNFLKVIDNHAKELLIRNKDFLGNNHYLFTDGSVEPPHNSFDFGYELKTKKLEFNISNFNKFSKFFEELSKVAYSNDTCGIHVHCSRKYFSLKKHFALLYAYIKNRYYKNFLEIENCQMSNSTYASLSRSKNYYYNRIIEPLRIIKKYIQMFQILKEKLIYIKYIQIIILQNLEV